VLFIIRKKTKRRATLSLKLLVAIFLISLICSHVYNMYNGKDVIREGWLRDDKPSGNPLRVENGYKAADKNNRDDKPSGNPMRVENQARENQENNPNVLDRFVVIVRDYYQKDQ